MRTVSQTISRGHMWTPTTERPQANRQARRRAVAVARLDAKAAAAKLARTFDGFLARAEEWSETRTGDAPRLYLRGATGLGKSTVALRVLGRPEWRARRVLYLTPTLALADELAAKALDLGIDARVIRGRSQLQPGQEEGGATMCTKCKLADMLAALSIDISNTLCRSAGAYVRKPGEKKAEKLPDEECEFAATCPYLAQLQDKRPGVLIAAHNYIPLSVEGLKAEHIDLVIVDERYWQTLTRQGRVSMTKFCGFRAPGKNGYGPKKGEQKYDYDRRLADVTADFEVVMEKVRHALGKDRDQPLSLDHLRAVELTPEECRFAKGVEYSRLGKPEITAGMSYEDQEEAIRTAKLDEAFGFARIWDIMARELELAAPEGQDVPRSQCLGLRRMWDRPYIEMVRNPDGSVSEVARVDDVLLTYHAQDPRVAEVPVVLIDADLDEEVSRRFYPNKADGDLAQVVDISAEWSNCYVRQVVDRVVGKSMFTGRDDESEAEAMRHANRREDLYWLMMETAERHGHPAAFSPLADDKLSAEERAARARRPLLVTYKRVEDAWVEAGIIEDRKAKETPLRNALPFSVEHFGDIRGKDDYKACSAVVVAGRPEPRPEEVEAMARCVFQADPRPLQFVENGERGKEYPKTTRPVTFRDGTEADVEVSYHPDPRCDALLRQIRESEVMQAVNRARLVHRQPGNPCEVIVVTSLPLPGLVVDETVRWADLVPDRFRRMELHGFAPDVAADAAAAYPDIWKGRDHQPSANAVRQARYRAGMGDGSDAAAVEHAFRRQRGGSYVRVEYRRHIAERTRAGAAMVRVWPGDTEADIAARVVGNMPGAVEVRVVGPLPDVSRDAERAALMLASAIAWLSGTFDDGELGAVWGEAEEVVEPDRFGLVPPVLEDGSGGEDLRL